MTDPGEAATSRGVDNLRKQADMKNLNNYTSAPDTFVERTLSRYEVAENGCWLYSGQTSRGGYAHAAYNTRGPNRRKITVVVHVLSYLIHRGPVIPGLQVDHMCHIPGECMESPCDHRRCINPAHLEVSTVRDNVLRSNSFAAEYAKRETCEKGHPFSGRSNGQRRCRICKNASARKSYARKRAGLLDERDRTPA